MSKFYSSVFTWVLSALKVQLVLMLCALPFIVSWGLSLSPLSFIGNIVFSPWITVYLACSLLWCIAALLHLPTTFISYIIECLTIWWLDVLSYASPTFLFSLPCPHPFILGAISLSTLCGIFIIAYKPLRLQVALYALLLGFWCITLQKMASKDHYSFAHGRGKLHLVPDLHGIALVDRSGILRSQPQQESWFIFTVRPELCRRYGARTCSALVLLHPSYRRLEAAHKLISLGVAPVILLPTETAQQAWLTRWKSTHQSAPLIFLPFALLSRRYGGTMGFDKDSKRCNNWVHHDSILRDTNDT